MRLPNLPHLERTHRNPSGSPTNPRTKRRPRQLLEAANGKMGNRNTKCCLGENMFQPEVEEKKVLKPQTRGAKTSREGAQLSETRGFKVGPGKYQDTVVITLVVISRVPMICSAPTGILFSIGGLGSTTFTESLLPGPLATSMPNLNTLCTV